MLHSSSYLLCILACVLGSQMRVFAGESAMKSSELAEAMWQSKLDDKAADEQLWKRATFLLEEYPTSREPVAFLLSFGNVVAIDTTEGLVMADTSSFIMSTNIHEQIRRWRPSSPLHTAIYTHGHYDHVFGVGPFEDEAVEKGWRKPTVVAHENVVPRFDRYKLTNGYNSIINARQFEGEHKAVISLPTNFRYPDVTYSKNLTLRIGNDVFELRHHMGETDDATYVWVPTRGVLCAGDLFIWNAPNCGNPAKVQRYAYEWTLAFREMLALNATTLFPGHGPPIVGAERVARALRESAEYLESIFEQTIALMNAGAKLDEIVNQVRPPAALEERPYLRPYYDEPGFIVRNIWRRYGGWYDQNPSHLKPPREEALAGEIASLAGGVTALVRRAEELAAQGTPDSLALACSLIEFAAAAEPTDPTIAYTYSQIYSKRSQDPSVTSLMAKGIFRAASVAKKAIAAVPAPALSFMDRVRSVLGWSVAPSKAGAVDLSTLDLGFVDRIKQPTVKTHPIIAKFGEDIEQNIANLWDAQPVAVDETDVPGRWQFVSESDGVRIARCQGELAARAPSCFRGVGVIDHPPRTVTALIVDTRYRKLWDPRSEEKLLEELDARTRLMYRSVAGRMIVAGRDLVFTASLRHDEAKGRFAVGALSVTHPDFPPDPAGKVVRAEILGGGMVIAPFPGNASRSVMTFLYMVDVHGEMPAMILEQVGKMQVTSIARIRDALN